MSQRLPFVDPATVPADEAELLAKGGLMLKHVIAQAPGILRPLLTANGVLLASEEITPRLRELVIMQAAAETDSDYVWAQHPQRAADAGVTDEEVEAVRTGRGIEGPDGIVLRYLSDLYAGHEPDDEQLEEVLSKISVRALVESIVTVGIYVIWGRLAEAAGLPSEPEIESFISASLVPPASS